MFGQKCDNINKKAVIFKDCDNYCILTNGKQTFFKDSTETKCN